MKVVRKNVKVTDLHLNTGQIKDVPKNPRFIKDEKFAALVKSIEEAPEMLELREVVAYDNNGELVVIMGNMRLRALKELKIKETVAKILPTDTKAYKLREYAAKDNIAYGQNDWDAFANEWDLDELESWGMDMSFLKNDEWDNLPEITEEQEDPQLEKPDKITVVVPLDKKDLTSEIAEKVKEAVAEYEGIEVK